MKKIIYSKSSKFYIDSKLDFFINNERHLKKSLKLNSLYSIQPIRVYCKLCSAKLSDQVDFESHGIGYKFCKNCNHLNGIYEDTKEFIENLYISDAGENYSLNYIDESFIKRSNDIYLPKVDFLLSNLPNQHYNLLDVGCGAGYFVHAAISKGLNAQGIDVSKTLIEYGNQNISLVMGTKPLKFVQEEDFINEIINTKAEIISAIGVIEHLREPHKFFEAFRQSDATHLMYSVPMFSFSVILENMFENVYPRQLSGAHTHLFTEESLLKMNELLNVNIIAEWRFGTDIIDLFRHIRINLENNNSSKTMLNQFESKFFKIVDDIQHIFDKNEFFSEIHVLVQKK